ncbi:hypothetical protein BDV26DRAFT_250832 [Aspergillus bertholletiae]|uniref:Uncharacterized protein n=1 Tax=Aspergillus bertholletiae TaxID=1226010 RepID=A0A5N7BQP1_9EURO|nr:hypothetical protein BDV26DRAFT_250832 [Aspergillus bertholletiae]
MPSNMASVSQLKPPMSKRSPVERVGRGARTVDEKRQRKKLQNRLNQRARRIRLREKNPDDGTTPLRPFQVYRWRLEDDTRAIRSKLLGEDLGSDSSVEPISDSYGVHMASRRSFDARLSLPADHLLHLIHYNVFRGVHHTKYAMAGSSAFVIPGVEQDEVRPGHIWFLGTSMFFATGPNLPESMVPTPLQMDTVHATWINFIPIPKMRDNLIAKESHYDHAEFVGDLLGESVAGHMFGSLWSTKPPIASKLSLTEGDDDDVTASRQGLILWGEAYRVESWEATPGFIRKWAWAMEGCEELIASSNRWRRIRGEDPIRVSVCE